MHKDFHHWCHKKHPTPGDAWMWGGPENVRIVNLITQEGGYGQGNRPGKATPKFVSDSLKALAKLVGSCADGLGVAPEILATRKELAGLLRGEYEQRVTGGWRREVIGAELLAAVA